ncbi:hypothetical protein MKX03_020903 [Papaver bracteatum]|nr:hypothetical protein MKX03_020903 [Papaver bracteatum]
MEYPGISSPLLPDHRKQNCSSSNSTSNNTNGGASISGAVFNVSTSIVGAGIMSIPATLKVLGVIPAIGLILIIALLADISADFLLRFTNSEKSTYAGVMGDSFGRMGSIMLQICVMITNLGCLIIYLIIIGDVLSGTGEGSAMHFGVLREWFGVHWWNSRAFVILFTLVFVLLPLVLFKRVESLRFTSAISIALAVVFVVISTVMAISALWQGKTNSPKLVPELVNKASFFELFTAVPVIVGAFTFHFNVHPIGAELGKPSDMVTAVRISLVLCSAIYIFVGFFGYLLFGESIMPDILVNFDQNFGSAVGSILNDVVRLSFALHLMLVFPLLNFSLRINLDGLLFPKCRPLASHRIRFVLLTCLLLVLVYIIAIAIPNIWYFFQFMGSTTGLCIAFIFPGAIVLRDVHGISTTNDKTLAVLMIGLAVITSSIAIFSNITSLVAR